jgi:hypothetical protein
VPRLAAYRQQLRERLVSSPLCNIPQFTQALFQTLSGELLRMRS